MKATLESRRAINGVMEWRHVADLASPAEYDRASRLVAGGGEGTPMPRVPHDYFELF